MRTMVEGVCMVGGMLLFMGGALVLNQAVLCAGLCFMLAAVASVDS